MMENVFGYKSGYGFALIPKVLKYTLPEALYEAALAYRIVFVSWLVAIVAAGAPCARMSSTGNAAICG